MHCWRAFDYCFIVVDDTPFCLEHAIYMESTQLEETGRVSHRQYCRNPHIIDNVVDKQ